MVDFSANKRIKKLIDYYQITPYEFAKRLGYKRPDNIYNVVNEKVGTSNEIIDKILNNYTNVNRIWLLTGEGEMFTDSDTLTEPPTSYTMKLTEMNYQAQLELEKDISTKLANRNNMLQRKIFELEFELNKIVEICKECEKCNRAINKQKKQETRASGKYFHQK